MTVSSILTFDEQRVEKLLGKGWILSPQPGGVTRVSIDIRDIDHLLSILHEGEYIKRKNKTIIALNEYKTHYDLEYKMTHGVKNDI